ncbi:ssrA-binding protein [Holospora obtusa F1]|uniref:SsrA-binding protein n=1 Tax=Holospora obtusa F1 TaxID=1399147 RepID=W6TFG7_HOLOB|nr:SsrA-binding protein SmpB [Holospora obtusa]ETZ07756.1 ssrA-binding protein [Holospora obtusa F1]
MSQTLNKILASNRKARFSYHILDTIEAGLVLEGSEVKSIREGKMNITESFVVESKRELFLYNALISLRSQSKNFGHDPLRWKKLLLHTNQIKKMQGQMQKKGMTVIPLSVYSNQSGRIKVQLGIATGKEKADKRETIKNREWTREKQRILKQY